MGLPRPVSAVSVQRGFVLVAGVFASLCSHAASVFFGTEYVDHDFTEYAESDARLVNESGDMLAPVLGIEHEFATGLILALGYWTANAAIDYEGSTQSGRPLLTSAHQDFVQTSGLAAYRLERGAWFARFQAAYSTWRWERRIEETAISLPLAIDYDWNQWSIGLGFGHRLQWGDVSVLMERLTNFDAKARLDLESYGAGQVLLEPGDDFGARLTFAHRYRFSSRWSTAQYLYFETQGFAASETVGISNGARILLFTEPRSETERIGIGVVFEYAFH
ncbi:MAG: hypothetical protein ACWGPN_14820 [Gammaproteobacteria bacterium]